MRLFTPDYRESVVLPSGLCVLFRLITPNDKEPLVRGLGRLSPQSRYLRFFTNKRQFIAVELSYLIEVDGENHFAIVAMRVLPDGSEDGVGIARVVRLRDDPTVAEAAVAVIDEVQRRGLGRALFVRLAAAAYERGIRRIHSEILAENKAIRAIIHQLAPHATLHHEGYLVTVDAPLPEIDLAADPDERVALNATYRLLALAARNELELRHSSRGESTPEEEESNRQGAEAAKKLL